LVGGSWPARAVVDFGVVRLGDVDEHKRLDAPTGVVLASRL
jgi:hypothetical protein